MQPHSAPASPPPTTCVRTILLPILKPLGATWDEFGADMRLARQLSTKVANRLLGLRAAGDLAANLHTEDKLPKLDKCNLYQMATTIAPQLPTGTASAIAKMVEDKYRGKTRLRTGTMVGTRWGVHNGIVSLPTYGSMIPFMVRHSELKLAMNPSGEATITIPILREGKGHPKYYTLALKGGGDWKPAYEAFRKAASGEIPYLDCKIIDKKTGTTDSMMAVVIAMRFPITARAGQGDFIVASHAGGLLRGTVRGQGATQPWWFNADHVPHLIIEHARRLRRLAEDNKSDRKGSARLSKPREVISTRYNHRMKTIIQQAAASILGRASRCRVERVIYDDAERGFASDFAWAALETAVKQGCEKHGIGFITGDDLRIKAEDKKATEKMHSEWLSINATLKALQGKVQGDDSTGNER